MTYVTAALSLYSLVAVAYGRRPLQALLKSTGYDSRDDPASGNLTHSYLLDV